MAKKETRLFTVECAACKKTFEKQITIYQGSEEEESNLEAYCPECQKLVSFTIHGKLPKDFILMKIKNL